MAKLSRDDERDAPQGGGEVQYVLVGSLVAAILVLIVLSVVARS